MVKRENYKPRLNGLSCQNEPGNDLVISGNVRLYPDMYYAYKKFSHFFNLKIDNFFLANGCENAMKNVLLGLKAKSLTWGIPTWRMPEVYCEALDITPEPFDFKYWQQEFIEPDWDKSHFKEVLYHNCGCTTGFTYEWSLQRLKENDYRYIILDLTYKTIDEMKKIIDEVKYNDRFIIVGSFDKLFGCGLRLGFAIFPDKLIPQMSLQREQYINQLAYDWLINTDFTFSENMFKKELKEEFLHLNYVTDNFITIKGDVQTTLPCHHFKVSNQQFTRFGIPNTFTEYDTLNRVLKDFYNDQLNCG